ncbi:hypothetical protein BGZ49_006803 [Haplosporangium sp. Z 27]|nr:hypothetical protein BGZ49_006803 [Haplosporangium sp. Z 27]
MDLTRTRSYRYTSVQLQRFACIMHFRVESTNVLSSQLPPPNALPVGRPALADYGSRRIQLHLSLGRKLIMVLDASNFRLSLEQEANYGAGRIQPRLSLEQEADYGSRRIQPRLSLEQEVA